MILEIAQFNIKAGQEEEFAAAVKGATPLFARAKGCVGMEVQRSIENRSKFVLFVWWETIENHMVDFRGSDDFQIWRNLVSPFWDGPPQMEHTDLVVRGD